MAASPQTQRLPERVARAREVFRLRTEEELTWPAVAAAVGCSERTARRAYAEHLRSAALAEDGVRFDPWALINRILSAQEAALDRLEQLMSSADNSNAAVGAARSTGTVGLALIAVMARTGLLPDPDRLRMAREIDLFGRALIAVADRHGAPLGEIVEELEALQERAAVGGTPEVPA